MSIRSKRQLSAAMVLTTLLLLPTAPALAHEGRRLGDLELVVGFGTEPAYAGRGEQRAAHRRARGETRSSTSPTRSRSRSRSATRSVQLPLEPAFDSPGEYRAWFIPTAAGQYAFHFTGTIDDEDVDETFTSGPDTFSDIEDPATIAFPAVDAPTTTELAEPDRAESTEALGRDRGRPSGGDRSRRRGRGRRLAARRRSA